VAICILLGVLLATTSNLCSAQNVRYDGVAQSPKGPIPFALVAVCTQPANTTIQPCSPLANLCSSLSDTSCSQPNPTSADSLGNYHFYAKQTQTPFTVQIYGSQVATPQVLTDQSSLSSANPTIIPVENFGAIGDWNGTTGTDNTAAIQACVTSLSSTGGLCKFQAKAYKITGTITISNSSVGLIGVNTAVTNTGVFTSTPTSSQIITTSASADIIDITGGGPSTTLGFNQVRNLRLSRTVIPTGTAKGLSIVYTYGTVVDQIQSEDSIYDFYFKGVGSAGSGIIQNSQALWGQNGIVETTGSLYGFYFDSAGGVNSPSPMVFKTAVSPASGVTSTTYGYAAIGTALEDLYFLATNTFQVNYGYYLNNGGVSFTSSTDIHIENPIDDSCRTSCIFMTGITGTVSITGGWSYNTASANYAVDIESSSNVSLVNHTVYVPGLGGGVLVHNGTDVNLIGLKIPNFGTGGANSAITLNTSNIGTISGNAIGGTTTTLINVISGTGLAISENTLTGTATNGIVLDSNSHGNTGLESNTCAATGGTVTNCIVDSGGNSSLSAQSMMCSPQAPTVSAGFNTGSIASTNGSCSLSVTVGTGAAGNTGTLALPAAKNGWNCFAFNITHPGAVILESTTSTTSAVLTNYGTTPGTPVNWTNSDVLGISCFAH
jgi:hypothetical protein